MPIIYRSQFKKSDNDILKELREPKGGLPRYAITSDDNLNRQCTFDVDYKRHDFNILEKYEGKYILKKGSDLHTLCPNEVANQVKSQYSQILSQVILKMIQFPLLLNRKWNQSNTMLDLQIQKVPSFKMASLIVDKQNKQIYYINSLLGLELLFAKNSIDSDTPITFSKLNKAVGNISATFIFDKKYFILDEIFYHGNHLFESIIDDCILGNESSRGQVWKKNIKTKFYNNLEEINYRQYKEKNLNLLSSSNGIMEECYNKDSLIQEILKVSYYTNNGRNSFFKSDILSNKRLESMDFLLNILNRLYINQTYNKNRETVRKVLQIFLKINKDHTNEIGGMFHGPGNFDRTLFNLMSSLL